jgi:hypothetical protein
MLIPNLRFTKFSDTHKNLQALENLPDFLKMGKTPLKSQVKLTKITPSDSEYPKPLL